MTRRILVIDDAEITRDSIAETLSRAGYTVTAAADPREALGGVAAGRFDLVIAGVDLLQGSDLGLLKQLREEVPGTPVVLIAEHAAPDAAVEAVKMGAFDYIKEPFEAGELEIVVDRALRHLTVLAENEYLKTRLEESDGDAIVVGVSRSIRSILAQIDEIAGGSSSVLICGERGTGKEAIARAIHARSRRSGGPFMSVNCAAPSARLAESGLFGHEAGSIAGAQGRRMGLFELAYGGTLLLEGVSEMDARLQAKLLRVLTKGAFERIGGSENIRIDVRIIAETKRELSLAVAEGRFREDLFGRLSETSIVVPPLRDRKEDIRPLAVHFLRKHAGTWPVKEIAEEGMACLEAYSWPGNVRELESIIERAIVLTDGPAIEARHLAAGLETASENRGLALAADMTLMEMEKRLILLTLERCGWHQARTARMLGIGERTLRDKMKKWGWQKRRKILV